MKKYFIIFFLALIASYIFVPTSAFAEDASSTPTKINARILPTVWYSTLSVNDGDRIKIYAGIQNNSNMNFTGNATFYVDDKELTKAFISSTADSLKDVSANWLAIPGDHTIQIKIAASLPADKALVSYETDKSSVSITRKITPEVVKQIAMNTADSIVSKADELASALADKIESYKDPIILNTISNTTGEASLKDAEVSTSTPKSGQVLGASTEDVSKTKGHVLGASTGDASNVNKKKGDGQTNSFFDWLMDLLASLVRNWRWTLGVIIVLFIILKIKGSRRR